MERQVSNGTSSPQSTLQRFKYDGLSAVQPPASKTGARFKDRRLIEALEAMTRVSIGLGAVGAALRLVAIKPWNENSPTACLLTVFADGV
ncbi:MAG: hypothetical protein ABJZ55_15740 [Fuerstiella sp.]